MVKKLSKLLLPTLILCGAFGTLVPSVADAVIKTNILRRPVSNIGLVAYWSFDGADISGDSVIDRSGNLFRNATMTGMGPTNAVAGKVNQALSFPGGSSYVVTDDINIMNNPSGLTMSLWMKTSTQTGVSRLLSIEGAYIISMRDGQLEGIVDGAEASLAQTQNIADNQWHHIVFTHGGDPDADGGADAGIIYIDNVASSTFGWSGGAYAGFYDVESLGRPTGIGGNPPPNTLQAFEGSLDEVRIYNRVISASEISALYRTGGVTVNASRKQVVPSGMVGYWSFNGQDMLGTTTAYDRSGSGRNGALSGMTATAMVLGKVGQALNFDGVNDRITLSNLDTYATHSVSLWLKRGQTSSATSEGLIGCNTSGGWSLGIDTTTDGRIYNGKIGTSAHYSTGVITDTNWHHVVETRDGTNVKFYIDGALDSTVSDTDASFSCSGGAASYAIGDANSSLPYKGRLDDVRLYNRVLTATEISQIYTRTK
jgi:hypothetical protein